MNKPIILLGEALGANEVRTQTPFVGSAGVELLRMLSDAGIITFTGEDTDRINRYWTTGDPTPIDMIWRMHPEVYRTNVFNLHPPGNDISRFCTTAEEALPGYPKLLKKGSGYVSAKFAGELDRLGDEIIAADPNLVIALGNTPLWALCGSTGISKIRGTTRMSDHTVAGFKVLPTYHPAAILRQWELRPTTVIDFIKAKREAEFPEIRRPECEIWIEPTLEDLEEFYDRYLADDCRIAVDIETAGNQITCIGFSAPGRVSLVIPFYDSRRKGKSFWPNLRDEKLAWVFVQRVLANRSIRKIFQNGLYDIAFLWRSVGIKTYGATEDTMLLHHSLQPESLKSLGYLGSVYTDHGPWKTERKGTTTIKRDE